MICVTYGIGEEKEHSIITHLLSSFTKHRFSPFSSSSLRENSAIYIAMIHTDIAEILCVKPKTKKKKTMEQDMKKKKTMKIEGEVVIMKKNVLDFKDAVASLLDRIHELLGRRVSLHLISSLQPDPGILSFNPTRFTFPLDLS